MLAQMFRSTRSISQRTRVNPTPSRRSESSGRTYPTFLALDSAAHATFERELDDALHQSRRKHLNASSMRGEKDAARSAFGSEYVGDANANRELLQYVDRCWTLYDGANNLRSYPPFGCVVQSSETGKSRVIKQLSRLTSTSTMNSTTATDMRVLYICSRAMKSTCYPEGTPLSTLCYDKALLKPCVVCCVPSSMVYWDTKCSKWVRIFANLAYDKKISDALARRKRKITTPLEPMSQVSTEVAQQYWSDASLPRRVVVLAIDEARRWITDTGIFFFFSLKSIESLDTGNGTNAFRMLREALNTTNGPLIGHTPTNRVARVSDLNDGRYV